jgi:hypothetical protein
MLMCFACYNSSCNLSAILILTTKRKSFNSADGYTRRWTLKLKGQNIDFWVRAEKINLHTVAAAQAVSAFTGSADNC